MGFLALSKRASFFNSNFQYVRHTVMLSFIHEAKHICFKLFSVLSTGMEVVLMNVGSEIYFKRSFV